MAYMTAEEVYQLVINTTPPKELESGFNNDIDRLKRIGSFSGGAQKLIHRIQTDPQFLRNLRNKPMEIIERASELSLEPHELRPLLIAAMLVEVGIRYTPEMRPSFAVIPDRETAKRRFAGQVLDFNAVRQEVVRRLVDRVSEGKDVPIVIQRPRLLLALEDLNLTEFFVVYFSLCARSALDKHTGGERLTVPVERSVLRALKEPNSKEAVEEGLKFLLGNYE